MPGGAARQVRYIKEPRGKWAAFHTTVKTAAIATATTLVINGAGGLTRGVTPVEIGMYVWYKGDLTEPPSLISNVVVAGGDSTLTIPALVNPKAVGDKIVVGRRPSTTALVDTFTVKKNLNKWSDKSFNGNTADDVNRRKGRAQIDGSLSYMLRPDTNNAFLVRSLGQDLNVTGTVPGSPVNTTLNGGTTVGATTAIVTSAAGLVVNDVIQIGVGTLAECRKITNIATNTLTLDVGLDFAHATAAAVAKVIAPFLHIILSGSPNLDTFTVEDFVSYDDEADTTDYTTNNSYLVDGITLKGVKVSSQADTGISVSHDFQAKNKTTVVSGPATAVPSEEVYDYTQEKILIDGTQNFRVEDTSLDYSNNLQDRFTKSQDNLAFTIRPARRSMTGSLKFFENAATQATFWTKTENDTPMSLTWQMTDDSTGYFTKFEMPKIILDEYDDEEFGVNDLIDATVPFTVLYDPGIGAQCRLTLSNSQYLPY